MSLSALFCGQAITPRSTLAHGDLSASGVSRDSRTVRPGEIYVAMGEPTTQAAHVAEARQRGAVAVVIETSVPGVDDNGPVFTVTNARAAFARASSVAHGLDRRCPPLIAAVGTAGKSTTVHCAWQCLGPGAARIGTIGWHDGTGERPNPQTTPPPEQLHAFLAGLADTCVGVAMEVSSHACDQHRCEGLQFAAIAFTGIGHDHLDYHGTMERYVAAKLSVFRWLKPGGLVVINADDARFEQIAAAAKAAGGRVMGLSTCDVRRATCDVRRAIIAPSTSGDTPWSLTIDGVTYPLPMRLPGAFNAWNAAAGALIASALGVPLSTALARLATLPAVPGRLELLAHKPDTYVDYAHTPDELTTMLGALRAQFPQRKIVCLFGCGGDRDRSKRGPMGVAALLADAAVLTTDNSRSEDPAQIARDVIEGIDACEVRRATSPVGEAPRCDVIASSTNAASDHLAPRTSHLARLSIELNRATAIHLARSLAGPDGIAVITGKGHETSQIIQGRTLPWDDRAFVASLDQDSAA